jgi:hypothetical protein
VLQNHDAQQHPDATSWSASLTISSRNLLLSLGKIDHAVDGFQNVIRSASLRHCHFKEAGLISSFGLHGFLTG